ncbi:MurR/RpiR family transcriptional regulator [Lacticaseibacillus pantheris]
MNNQRLSLIYNLLRVFNDNTVGSVNYELARFFLEQYQSIPTMNIYDASESNHVSRATVRRFCEQLGYSNFKELKEHFQDFNDGREKYRTFFSGDDFRLKLVRELVAMTDDLSRRMNTPETRSIIHAIINSDQIIVLASSETANAVRTFQQEMVYFGKTIRIAADSNDIDALRAQITERSLIMVISISGLFAKTIFSELKNLPGNKVLFTLKRDVEFNQDFDKVYHLRTENNEKVSSLIYYTYGIDFVLDILFKEYLDVLYGDGN